MDIFELSGEKLRELREVLTWSREYLSEISGVPSRTIQDIETGVSKNPGIETLKLIAKALPNFPKDLKSKAEMIVDIQSKIASLNLVQLTNVLDSILEIAKHDVVETASQLENKK